MFRCNVRYCVQRFTTVCEILILKVIETKITYPLQLLKLYLDSIPKMCPEASFFFRIVAGEVNVNKLFRYHEGYIASGAEKSVPGGFPPVNSRQAGPPRSNHPLVHPQHLKIDRKLQLHLPST